MKVGYTGKLGLTPELKRNLLRSLKKSYQLRIEDEIKKEKPLKKNGFYGVKVLKRKGDIETLGIVYHKSR